MLCFKKIQSLLPAQTVLRYACNWEPVPFHRTSASSVKGVVEGAEVAGGRR